MKVKDIPNVEKLRYHGTKEEKDIKIFVSNRIDFDAVHIDGNPLFIPVRCGAVYDERQDVEILGDDTGENISSYRIKLNEFTVQYWAWKNIKADYYGLCHYRRYLNFSDTKYPVDVYNNVMNTVITEAAVKKYGLYEEKMREVILDNDLVCIEPADVRKFPENFKNVKEHYVNSAPYLLEKDIEILEDIIKSDFPKFYPAAKRYLYGNEAYFCNLYVMKKELFEEFSEFLFSVLKILLDRIDMSLYSGEGQRSVAHLGERVFGVYITYVLQKGKKIKCLQNVVFYDNEQVKELNPVFDNSNCITVTIPASDSYVPYLATLLESIKENSESSHNYDVVVLSHGITKRNKKLLMELFVASNRSLRFFNIASYLEDKNLYVKGHLTKMTYARLAILEIFKEYDRVLCLDGDIVVNMDLYEFRDMEIDGNYVAAVRDTVMAGWCNGVDDKQYQYNVEKLGLVDRTAYFNAGVLLFNIPEFRKKYTSDELYKMAENDEWKWMEQDILNYICKGKVLYLNNRYNFMTHFYSDERELVEFYAPKSLYEDYKDAQMNPFIVHYAGNVLPPNVLEVNGFSFFWKYARNTIYYEKLLSIMTHNAMHSMSSRKKLLPFRLFDYTKNYGFMQTLRHTVKVLIGKEGILR